MAKKNKAETDAFIDLIKKSVDDGKKLFHDKKVKDAAQKALDNQAKIDKKAREELQHEVTASTMVNSLPNKIKSCISSGSNLVIPTDELGVSRNVDGTLSFWEQVAQNGGPAFKFLQKCNDLGVRTTIVHINGNNHTENNFALMIRHEELLKLSGSR